MRFYLPVRGDQIVFAIHIFILTGSVENVQECNFVVNYTLLPVRIYMIRKVNSTTSLVMAARPQLSDHNHPQSDSE